MDFWIVIMFYLFAVGFTVFVIKAFTGLNDTFYKISRIICWFGIFLLTFWLLTSLLPSKHLLTDSFLLLAAILAPLFFLIFIIFLLYYGIRTIIKKDTLIKVPLLGVGKPNGVFAYCYGLLFILAALYLFLIWIGAISIFACNSNYLCNIPPVLEPILKGIEKMMGLFKPLITMGG
jgi:hypothetical protein